MQIGLVGGLTMAPLTTRHSPLFLKGRGNFVPEGGTALFLSLKAAVRGMFHDSFEITQC